MNENKINIENTIKEVLEQEGQEKGIQIIRDIVNSIAKNKRKTKIRVNTFDSIAMEVYSLMYEEKYSRSRAIDKVSFDKDLAVSSINNHLTKFNNIAKEDDYMNFGYFLNIEIDKMRYYEFPDPDEIEYDKLQCLVKFSNKYNVDIESAKVYNVKYKLDIRKKENKNFLHDYESKYSPIPTISIDEEIIPF
jgi:hypothetical protein